MASNPDRLIFDIDLDALTDLQEALAATEGQLIASYNRALKRTSVTLAKLGAQLVRDELKVKKVKAIRRRIKKYTIKSGGLSELKIWFGLNDMPVRAFKGRMTQVGDDAKLSAASPELGVQRYRKGFVGSPFGHSRSIYTRTGKGRYALEEGGVAITHLQEAIEDDVFGQLPEIFMRHFEADLKGRVKIGKENKYVGGVRYG